MGVVRGRRGAEFGFSVEQQRPFAAFARSRVRLGHSGRGRNLFAHFLGYVILEPDRLRWIDAFCALFARFGSLSATALNKMLYHRPDETRWG